jgi:hypothetical protein
MRFAKEELAASPALTPTVKHFGINYFFFSDSSCRFFCVSVVSFFGHSAVAPF